MNNILEREKEIMQMYKDGKTLEYIGKNFDITRSRVQQILFKSIRQNILQKIGFNLKEMREEEKRMLEIATKEELKELNQKRKKTEQEKKKEELQEKIETLPNYKNFSCVSQYAKALKTSSCVLNNLFPETYNYLINKSRNKWSQRYDRCRECGTTTIKHQSYGLCRECYLKSEYFKDIMEACRLRNKHKWKNKQKEYAKEYLQRPEVKAKIRKNNDIKNFGGKREKVLARDNFKCTKCGLTQEKSYKKYGRDLYVRHINNNKNDHSLSNMTSLCFKCFSKVGKFSDKTKLNN